MTRKGPGRANKRSKLSPLKRSRLPTVFLGYVHPRSPGLVHEAWHNSVLHLFAGAQGNALIRPQSCATGPLLSRARNRLVQQFLEIGDDYFLWTDTDIIFTYEDLSALLLADKDIAGSVYFTLDGGGEPVVAHLQKEEGQDTTYSNVPVSDCYDDDGAPKDAFPVAGLGCGFTLIKREVLVGLSESHGGTARLWPYAETGEEEGFGEDLTFCLRAQELGFSSWLVPASRVGHIKEIVL